MHYVVGLISDTHGVFDKAAAEALRHSDLLIHAGDVGHHGRHREVLQLYAEATGTPLLAVAGNVDDKLDAADAQLLPQHRLMQVAGWRLLVCHIVAPGPTARVDTAAAALIQQLRPDIVVCGHSHKACCWQAGDVCYVNPGSAGPARFKLPRTVAMLELPCKTAAAAAAAADCSCPPAGGTGFSSNKQPSSPLQPAQFACVPETGKCTGSAASGRVLRSRAGRAVTAGRALSKQRTAVCSRTSDGQGSAKAVTAGEAAAAGAGGQGAIAGDAWLRELHIRFVQLPPKAPPRLPAGA
ncbi:Metallo-dependent phosphatase-like protein [Scenedesmus sp. NREL 46B-D3]|nr:Metallo-dependent phosphatase-like protein [Scenedesmus sp. NREL 46B-D3]